jgi:hypothetical protein
MFAAIWYSMPTKHKRGQNEIQFPPLMIAVAVTLLSASGLFAEIKDGL